MNNPNVSLSIIQESEYRRELEYKYEIACRKLELLRVSNQELMETCRIAASFIGSLRGLNKKLANAQGIIETINDSIAKSESLSSQVKGE